MNSLRNIDEEADYYCLVQCDCGRKYKPEEMFLCYCCSKIKCNFCLITEANIFHCKGICNKEVPSTKKTRTSCEKCLECPLCFSPLLSRNFNKKYYLFCTSCYWNSQSIHISKEKKEEFENYIALLNQEKNNGFLRGMYDNILNQLSKDNLFAGEIEKDTNVELFKFTTESDTVQKAMEKTEQNFEEFDQRIKDEILLNEKTSGDKYEYNDNYLNNDDNKDIKNVNFKLKKNKLLSCYNDFNLNFNSLSEVKTAFNSNTLSINAMTTLEQRINNPVFQNNMVFNTYPRFIDLIPKQKDFYKKCKECGKTIVSIPDMSDTDVLLHSYISCLPVIYINKIDWESNLIKLKFVLVAFNDLIISFKEDKLNQTKIILPEGEFNVKNEKTLDKKIIIDFKFDEKHKSEFIKNRIYIFRFIIKAEFKKDGIGESSFFEYPVEIKFK